jgi:hypothetical protein
MLHRIYIKLFAAMVRFSNMVTISKEMVLKHALYGLYSDCGDVYIIDILYYIMIIGNLGYGIVK